MSPFVYVILIAFVAGTIALAGYLWVIKTYYWAGTKRDRRRKQDKPN